MHKFKSMPRDVLRVSIPEWAEQNIVLPPTDPHPGPLTLVPYQRGILNGLSAGVKETTLMMCSQAGKTLTALCIIGYYIDQQPTYIFMVNPRVSDTTLFRFSKLQPFLDNEYIKPKVAQKNKPTTGVHNQELIQFAGGMIMFGNSGSMPSLRGRTAQVVLADEVDAYEGSFDAEDPLNVISQRAIQYGDRGRLIYISTPVGTGTSIIHDRYKAGSMERWQVRCQCGARFFWDWDDHVRIEGRKATLVCPNGCVISERERLRMNYAGRWVATQPEMLDTHRSYHLNQLGSVHVSFADTWAEAQKANNGQGRGFRTQCLAIPQLKEIAAEIDQNVLSELYTDAYPDDFKPEYRTCGVDVQGNRVEYTIVDWVEGEVASSRCFVQRHGVVSIPAGEMGLTAAMSVVDGVLRENKVDLTFVDRGFMPDSVRDAIRLGMKWAANSVWSHAAFDKDRKKHFIPRVMPCKGSSQVKSTLNEPVVMYTRNGEATIATDEAKGIISDLVAAKLAAIHEPGVPITYTGGLTSEHQVEGKWVRKSDAMPNEPLDCFVYALGARNHIAAADVPGRLSPKRALIVV